MDSIIKQGPEIAVPSLCPPLVQGNALDLFETVAWSLANMAHAGGIFVALGFTVSLLRARAPWAFLLAMAASFASANTLR